MKISLAALVVSALLFVPAALPAQEAAVTSLPVSVVPHLIKFSGVLPGAPAKAETVDVKFSLYAAQTGGEPVWSESQQVLLDAAGKYSVLLGSVAALPDSVFAQGQARWIGVTLRNEQESARTVLVAAPYSLKASDAETLGGHPASDFSLKNALPASGTNITQINVGNGVTGGGTGPTVTLGLSNSYLQSLGNEIYPQLSGTNTLTGVNAFGAGKVTIGGSPALSVANVKAGSGITVTPSGSAVSVALNESTLLSLGNSVYAQLGAANTFGKGQTFKAAVTFASGQTFPGTVSLSGNNTFSGSNTFSKAVTFASGQSFPGAGTITGVTAGTGLTGGGSSGNVTLNVNAAALESTYNSVYAGLTANDIFSGNASFTGLISMNGSAPGSKLGVTNTATSGATVGVYAEADSSTGYGMYAVNTSASNIGTIISVADYGAAIWADTNQDFDTDHAYAALIASGDNTQAAALLNESNEYATLGLENDGSAGTGAVHMLVASSPKGVCGISGTGDVKCSGRFAAAVPLSGTSQQVEVYAVQSSENWFEDFGSAKLANGSVTVAIDPKFAQIVNTGVQYHVFLTPEGNCKGLFVTNKGANRFEVRELGDGGSSVEFDYRIVAKRNGHEAERLVDVTAEMRQMTKPRDELALKRANGRHAAAAPPIAAPIRQSAAAPEKQ